MCPGKSTSDLIFFAPDLKCHTHRMSTWTCTHTGRVIGHPSPVLQKPQSCDSDVSWDQQVKPCWSHNPFLHDSLSVLSLTSLIYFPPSTSLNLILISFDFFLFFLTWLIFRSSEYTQPKWHCKNKERKKHFLSDLFWPIMLMFSMSLNPFQLLRKQLAHKYDQNI